MSRVGELSIDFLDDRCLIFSLADFTQYHANWFPKVGTRMKFRTFTLSLVSGKQEPMTEPVEIEFIRPVSVRNLVGDGFGRVAVVVENGRTTERFINVIFRGNLKEWERRKMHT